MVEPTNQHARTKARKEREEGRKEGRKEGRNNHQPTKHPGWMLDAGSLLGSLLGSFLAYGTSSLAACSLLLTRVCHTYSRWQLAQLARSLEVAAINLTRLAGVGGWLEAGWRLEVGGWRLDCSGHNAGRNCPLRSPRAPPSARTSQKPTQTQQVRKKVGSKRVKKKTETKKQI